MGDLQLNISSVNSSTAASASNHISGQRTNGWIGVNIFAMHRST